MVQDNLWSASLQCHWFCFCLCSYCHPSENFYHEKAQTAHWVSSSQRSLSHVSHNSCLSSLRPATQLSYCAPKDVMVLKDQEGNNERTNSENILSVISRMGIAKVLIQNIQNEPCALMKPRDTPLLSSLCCSGTASVSLLLPFPVSSHILKLVPWSSLS